MNIAQRKYFAKRVDEIKVERKRTIRHSYTERKNKVKTPRDRVLDWWAKAPAKEIQAASFDLLERLMQLLHEKGMIMCSSLSLFPTSRKHASDGLLEVADLAYIASMEEIDKLNAEEQAALRAEDTYAERLKDSAMFAETAEELNKAILAYGKRKLNQKEGDNE